MVKYLIDENLPVFFPVRKIEEFIHVSQLPFIDLDSDIWEYALKNELVIITKDSDFYYRCLSSKQYPKVIWIRIGNLKKKSFNSFIESIWLDVEEMLFHSSFIIINEDTIEGF
jgi:predicted nuclease of predicted toxin-antitoxin system